MKTLQKTFLLALLIVVLAGCSQALRWNPETHTVGPGDTLYSIALRYNLDHRQIASWNNLGNGTYIREGQTLRLSPPSASQRTSAGSRSSSSSGSSASSRSASPPPPPPVLKAPGWGWPTNGSVSESYAKTGSGIRIAGTEGQPVVASAAGEVVYAGSGLKSYGQLVIVKHNDTWLTAYGFNSLLLVREGDRVAARQQIAEMGKNSRGKELLHFEIRRNGKPVDPLGYLPKR